MISGTADQLEVRRPGLAAAAADDAPTHEPAIPPMTAHVGTAAPAARTDATSSAALLVEVGTDVAALAAADRRAPVGTAGPVARIDATSVAAPLAHVGTTAPAAVPLAEVGTDVAALATAGRRAHVGTASRLTATDLRTQAKAALTGLGWKPAIANAAVSAAAAAHGSGITLERLIFESLRRCPVPNA